MGGLSSYAEVVIALFVIADPLGNIPVFISLTAGQTDEEKKRTVTLTAATMAAVLVLAVLLGDPLLRLFGIRIASFRVAGGILLLMMAVAMMYGSPNRVRALGDESETAAKETVAVVPLAVPLLAGPGAISTVIIYAERAAGWFDTMFILFASLFVTGLVWVAFRLAEPIRKILGKTGIDIVTRLLGLLLTAVAVEFISSGVAQLLPGLAGR